MTAETHTTPSAADTAIKCFLIALAYAVMGKVGLLLSIPPGYATLIWPSSGIALGGILIFGFRIWPGILLGSFLVNVWTGFDGSSVVTTLQSLIAPGFVAAGAALQAVIGGILLHRFAAFPNSLPSEREVISFFFFGGILGCLVNASIGTITLITAGIVPPSNAFTNFATWWGGDVMGVLIFTPLMLVWLSKPRDVWAPRRLTVTLPTLVAFGLVVLAVSFGSNWERERLTAQFEHQTSTIASTLDKYLALHVDVIRSLTSFYAASEKIDRREFAQFVERPLEIYPGIQALSWNPRILDKNRESYENSIRNEGHKDFRITERNSENRLVGAHNRDQYITVNFIEPFAKNRKAFGFDVASNPTRKKALEQARDTGKAIATGRITLVQETAKQFGILIFVPVYKNGMPHDTIAERRNNLAGYMVGVFRGGDIVAAALQGLKQKGIEYRLIDESAPKGQQFLHQSSQARQSIETLTEEGVFGASLPIKMSFPILIGERQWRLDITPNQTYLAANRPDNVWLILVIGMVMTAMVEAFVLVISGRNSVLEKTVGARTLALNTAKKEAEKANKAKSEFLATMSHEIRTPMTAVLGVADLILESKISSQTRQQVKRIRTATLSLMQIINDILDISKFDAEKLEFEYADFNAPLLITEVVDLFREQQKGHHRDNLEIAANIDPGFPTGVYSDPVRIRQILINLLGNAIKFTEKGSVTLSARLEHGGKGEFLKFSIQDTGIGIKPENLKSLFDDFTQADTSITRRYQGTGLGLAISKRLVEKMGGEIGVESEFGKGATFWFTIPYSPAKTDVSETSATYRPSIITKVWAKQPLNILLAEDNQLNQMIIPALLKSMGHQVMIAGNGIEALEQFRHNDFDVILMDIRMPEMSGLDATRAIRQLDGPKAAIPIIALTADAMKDNRTKCLEAGMDEMATKPIDRNNLAMIINNVLGKKIHDFIEQEEAPESSAELFDEEIDIKDDQEIADFLEKIEISTDKPGKP